MGDMHERKAMMARHADAFIAMPGEAAVAAGGGGVALCTLHAAASQPGAGFQQGALQGSATAAGTAACKLLFVVGCGEPLLLLLVVVLLDISFTSCLLPLVPLPLLPMLPSHASPIPQHPSSLHHSRTPPGGFGTLEELLEVITWQQLGYHAKPVGLLNVEGFYDPLMAFFRHAIAEVGV